MSSVSENLNHSIIFSHDHVVYSSLFLVLHILLNSNARCFSKTWTYRNEGSPDWIFQNVWLLKSDFSRSWSEMAAQRYAQVYPFHSEPQHCGAVSVCRKLIAPKNNASLVQAPSFHSLGLCTECALGRRMEHFRTGEDSLQCFKSKASFVLFLLGKTIGSSEPRFTGKRGVGKSVPISSVWFWKLGKPPEISMGNLSSHCVHPPNCQDLVTQNWGHSSRMPAD